MMRNYTRNISMMIIDCMMFIVREFYLKDDAERHMSTVCTSIKKVNWFITSGKYHSNLHKYVFLLLKNEVKTFKYQNRFILSLFSMSIYFKLQNSDGGLIYKSHTRDFTYITKRFPLREIWLQSGFCWVRVTIFLFFFCYENGVGFFRLPFFVDGGGLFYSTWDWWLW